jgi:hypothetical protein
MQYQVVPKYLGYYFKDGDSHCGTSGTIQEVVAEYG